jgi:bifunctional non-homologous end joining protein LigD
MGDRQAPAFIEPMLLTRGDQIPEGSQWLAQVKVDGARGQLRVGDGPPSLRTRHGRQCASEFPEIIASAAGLPDTILDGEIAVVGSDGAPDFAGVLARLGRSATRSRAAATVRPATFFAFDVLWHRGKDLRRLPLARRLQVLESLCLDSALIAVDTFPGKAAEVLEFARAHHLEGATVKRADSIYRSGRAGSWLKFKVRHPSGYGSPHGSPADPANSTATGSAAPVTVRTADQSHYSTGSPSCKAYTERKLLVFLEAL